MNINIIYYYNLLYYTITQTDGHASPLDTLQEDRQQWPVRRLQELGKTPRRSHCHILHPERPKRLDMDSVDLCDVPSDSVLRKVSGCLRKFMHPISPQIWSIGGPACRTKAGPSAPNRAMIASLSYAERLGLRHTAAARRSNIK